MGFKSIESDPPLISTVSLERIEQDMNAKSKIEMRCDIATATFNMAEELGCLTHLRYSIKTLVSANG